MIRTVERCIETDSIEIERVSTIDKDTFYRNYLHPKKPVVMTDIMNEWAATQKWSIEFLTTLTPKNPSLSIEEGNILQETTHFQSIQFQEYVETLLGNRGDKGSKPPAYLADFNIFETFPELRNDVDFSLLSSNTIQTRMNGWIGPGGTVASYHVDWAENLFAQIQGRKLVRLISPQYNDHMYPSIKFDAGSLLSSVDADNYDAEKYPRFQEVECQQTILEPGEMLYIPYGWWHYIRALEPSISINCFGWTLKGTMIDLQVKKLKKLLHSLHLYGMDGCTCHMVQDGKRVSRSMNY